jgi:transcriptional regulator with XRE-family HTH domain
MERDIARKLRDLRIERGMSQAQIGSALDLSASQVSRIESGKRGLSIEQLGPWARVLGVLDTIAGHVDAEGMALLRQVAGSVPHMTPPARAALSLVLQLWRAESLGDDLDTSEPATFT